MCIVYTRWFAEVLIKLRLKLQLIEKAEAQLQGMKLKADFCGILAIDF